jgi:hypothetical protein
VPTRPSNPPSRWQQQGQQTPVPMPLPTSAPMPSPTAVPTPQPSGPGQGGADAASSASSSGSTMAASTQTVIIVAVVVVVVACGGFLIFSAMQKGNRSPYEVWMQFHEKKNTSRLSSGFEDLYSGPARKSVEMQSPTPGFFPYLTGRTEGRGSFGRSDGRGSFGRSDGRGSLGRSSLNNGAPARTSSISAQRVSLSAEAFRRSSLASPTSNRGSLSPAPGTHHSRK